MVSDICYRRKYQYTHIFSATRKLSPPHLMKDAVELGKAQRKAMNTIKQPPYEERLKRLELCLGSRRLRRHTAEVYRIKGD